MEAAIINVQANNYFDLTLFTSYRQHATGTAENTNRPYPYPPADTSKKYQMAQESHKHTDSTMQSGYEIPTAHEDIVSKQHHGAGGVESKKPADEFQARIKKFRIKHAVSFKQDAVAMAASVPTHNYQKEEQCTLVNLCVFTSASVCVDSYGVCSHLYLSV